MLSQFTIALITNVLIIFTCLFQYFQKELPGKVESDIEGLFNLAYSIKINTKKMKKMEKDYAELRKKEQEEMVELRVRKINSIVQYGVNYILVCLSL